MKNIILVAKREYRQITRMRSFWLTLLILPFAFAIAPLAQRFMDKDEADRVMVVDQGDGASARAVADRVHLEEQRRVLNELSRYVQKHKLPSDPAALWAQHDRWYSDAEVARFTQQGGVTAALDRLRSGLPEGTTEFEAPDPQYELVPAPAELSRLQGAPLDTKVEGLLRPADEKVERIDYVVLIPRDFAQTGVVRLWTAGRPSSGFINTVQEVLTRSLRQALLIERGVAPEVAAAASTVTPSLLVTQPPPGGGAREAVFVRSILPLASSYLLMMALMLSGSWMLQGTVEERSNKLLETVLAAVSPEELMYGKLLGTVGVGLTMIAVWIGCGVVAAYATQGVIADMIRPALAPLTSPGTIAAMVYFFVVGYVAISVFFLAVGVISDSMNDAQGYLMPIILAIVLPITILIQGIMDGGQGLGITLLTWIPIWTPFAVLARLGAGIPAWEVMGSGLLLAAFVVVELVLLGRLFRASLLAQGQKPGVAELFARMKRQRA
ncbi:MAG: ABC transporter permease [Pseudomonadota bacterium]|nr:ABC transporter permease [Pseudomonadota bacterium]